MAFETNRHVDRLTQYLPFDPSHGQIYEETTDPDDAPRLETRALDFVTEVVQRPDARLVILTGDAGHGKTHLCRRVLEWAGLDAAEALRTIKAYPRGEHAVETAGGLRLRVVKDLSELDPATAGNVLLEALEGRNGEDRTLVCANEGRLRDVIYRVGARALAVRVALSAGLNEGITTVDGTVFVLNLNYQSTTASADGSAASLLDGLLAQWVLDGRKWKTCERYDAAQNCPIVNNRRELAGNERADPRAAGRRAGLQSLLRIVEESGQVVTIRELLILIAYLVTGGVSCDRVAERVRAKPNDDAWQWSYAYHEALFHPWLSKDQSRSLPVLQHFRKLDPGAHAIRRVDEPLSTGVVERDEAFPPPFESAPDRAPRTRKQAKEEGERLRKLMMFLRRRDYFELATDAEDVGMLASRAERLGLRFYDDFEFLRSGRTDPRRFVACRDKLLAGLHAVQGIHSVRSDVHFYVLDPAFGRTQSVACVVARRLPARNIEIESESRWWRRVKASSGASTLPEALNWLDRRVVVSFEGPDASVDLDLMQFEYVMRAADGLSCRNFFRADIRRLMARIARLVRRGTGDDDGIPVLVRGKLRNVTIDRGFVRTGES